MARKTAPAPSLILAGTGRAVRRVVVRRVAGASAAVLMAVLLAAC